MSVITINDKKIEVAEGVTVLEAALNNGIFIPHFCWHPLLSVSGNCRMCVVEVEGRSKLEVSCNLPASDGMIIRTETEEIKKMRRSVLEFLLINHPLDCPICDQAGECLLQDYHFKYSGQGSRFKEEKNHKSKRVSIGEQVVFDSERCVLCTRCVRFCSEVAKSAELTVAQRGDKSYITTAPGKNLNNPYSLNTVDICPVGALTAKDFRFKKRVWFLKSTPSICPSCSNGCPIWIDHSDGITYRFRTREGANGFLCNEGKLSYKTWQQVNRISKPLVRIGDDFVDTTPDEAVDKITNTLREYTGESVIGIVSAQSSNEEIDDFISFISKVGDGAKLYKSKRTPENPAEDGILRKRDKNPNSYYLNQKNIENIPEDLHGKILVVLDTLTSDDVMKITGLGWKLIVQLTHGKNFIIPGADVVLPTATFMEMDGHLTNYNGEVRKFCKAFESPDGARVSGDWLKLINDKIK